MDKIRKRNLFIVLGVCVFTILLIGATYAFFAKVLFNDMEVNTITHGLDYYINYAKGTDITSGTLVAGKTYTDGNNVTVTLNKKDNTYDIYGHIYLDVTSIGDILKNSTSLKYVVVDDNNTQLATGNLKGVSSNSSKLLASNIVLGTSVKTYTIYLWLDETDIDNYDIEGETISANIRCEATMQPLS